MAELHRAWRTAQRRMEPRARASRRVLRLPGGATMLVDQREDGTIVLRPAVTVPADEAWLWKNKKALAMVQEGLAEARQGKHVAAPDMAAARKLAARIKD